MNEDSAVPANSAEVTRDLQDRFSRFARNLAVISGVMLLASLTNAQLVGPDAAPISAPSRLVHVGATVLALVTWLVLRGKAQSLRVIHTLDAALTFVLCACWALLGIGIAPNEPIEFSVILATTYTLIARSVLVPSTFLRTLVINTASIAPTIAFFFIRKMSFVPNAPASQVQTFLMFATVWCMVAVFAAALQSSLLFGLRRRIREATRLGQYTLNEKIGEGGMGAVYRATHAMLRRPAAIKLLHPERAGEREIARFEREVQLTSQLRHPNTISIFDYGRTADGTFYYVMELLDGFDLDVLVQAEGALPAWRVLHVLSQVSGALVEAHGLGLIHRDIKPANVILTRRSDEPDVVKVVDFGLVKALSSTADEPMATQANTITGTPLYLAPEAIKDPQSVDARADLYALGAVGYFLLTGQHVFEAKTVLEVCSKHLLEVPVAPSLRTTQLIPHELERLVMACLAKAPENRPDSAATFKQAVDACAAQTPHDRVAAGLWWQNRAPAVQVQRAKRDASASQITMTVDLLGRALRSAS